MATTKKKQNTAVAKVDENVATVATARPDFMKTGSVRGTETLDKSDFEIPRVSLLQALSPEVQEKGLRAGLMYHNILEAVVQDEEGSNVLSIIPVMNRVRYVLWNPRHLGGGMLAVAEDGVNWSKPGQEFKIRVKKDDAYEEVWKIGKTVHELTMCPDADGNPTKSIAEFGTSDTRNENSSPAATKSYNILCRAANRLDIGPFIVIVQKTSEKEGKKLNQKIRTAGVDSFGQVFKMSGTFVDDGVENKYWKYTFSNAGFVDEPTYKSGEAMYETFKAMEVWNIKDEEAEAPTEAPTEAPAESGATSDEM